ncbi:MAG: hypothetical protein AB4352_29935 [Hormoscilla sp.]
MNPESLEIVKENYEAGKIAFECGRYRAAVEHLEKASGLVNRNGKLGGDVLLWLAIAYEAAGKQAEARAVCQQMQSHPSLEARKEGKRLLYILEAPQLKRPEAWMTKIPDLGSMSESEVKYRRGTGVAKNGKFQGRVAESEVDLTQVNTEDNRFIWVALILASLTICGLIWLS